MILTLCLLIPLAGGLALFLPWCRNEHHCRWLATIFAALPFLLLLFAWARFDLNGPLFQHVVDVAWVPSLGMGFRLGVDGIALAIATMSALLFSAAVFYPVDTRGRPRNYYAWMLFLEAVSLGVFLSLDLLLFYVFFDLNLVAMYFLIGRWGHGDAQYSALKFFIFTLAGSLALLLGILGLYLAAEPATFDMRILIEQQPLAGAGLAASLVLLALLFGLAVKTPLVPVHTWLPQAHVDAPGPVSAILAGVLLKMGAYGMLRLPLAMMRESFQRWGLVLIVVALFSILYGALVALAQSNLKRRIAYTSINHMGYTVLGIAVAGSALGQQSLAGRIALTGAVVEIVAHGLITGALFLMAGSFWQRKQEYEIGAYGGLANNAPWLTAAMVIAAFASLGMPGLAGFVAEFQIFTGTFALFPWLAALGLLGILITAALFLDLLQKVFFGELSGCARQFPDLAMAERSVLAVLLVLVVAIGVYPRFLLRLIEAAAAILVGAN